MRSTSHTRWFGFILALSLAACSGGSHVTPAAPTIGLPRTSQSVLGQAVFVTPNSLQFSSPSAAAQTFIGTQDFSGDQTAVVSTPACATVSPTFAPATVDPTTGGQKTVTYTVTPIRAGTCTITVTDKKGDTAVVTIGVSSGAEFIYIPEDQALIAAYTVDMSSGALTPVAGSPFSVPGAIGWFTPTMVAVDPYGKFAYTGSVEGVFAYTINAASGALTLVSGSPFPAPGGAEGVVVDPTGKFVYAGADGGSGVSAYTINATSGALTPVPGSPFAGDPGSSFWAMAATSKFLYVVDDNGGTVFAYTINATSGALTPVAGSPFGTPLGCGQSVAVDPSGKFAYVINSGCGLEPGLFAYSINPTSGALTQVAGSPYSGSNGVVVDPTGKFAYATGSGVPQVDVFGYTINTASGALTPAAGSPFVAGISPTGVAVDPSGKFAYVMNTTGVHVGDGATFAYSINPTTGALTPVTGSPFALGFFPNFGVAIARPR